MDTDPIAITEPVRRLEVFTDAGRRRTWRHEDKVRIVAEIATSEDTVCAVARRHGLSPQQLFGWRRQLRDSEVERSEAVGLEFVPAVVAGGSSPVSPPRTPRCKADASAGTIEVEIIGVTVRIGRGVDAVAGKLRQKDRGPVTGTLAWYIGQYRQSSAWLSMSLTTRRQREHIIRQILETAGTEPLSRIDRKAIIAGRERRAHTPFQARHFLDTMRRFFQWAVENEYAKTDPTAGLKIIKPKTDDDITAYEKRWPRGTRERLMFDIFLYTGLRRGDATVLGKQHVRAGVITIDTEKTGTRVVIPMLPELLRTLKAGPTGEMTYIVSADGKPMAKEVIGNLLRAACRAAGVKKSAHGLRKAAATRAANNGATVAQLEAIFGWEGGRMASHYTKQADRASLAAAAMTKLSRKKKK